MLLSSRRTFIDVSRNKVWPNTQTLCGPVRLKHETSYQLPAEPVTSVPSLHSLLKESHPTHKFLWIDPVFQSIVKLPYYFLLCQHTQRASHVCGSLHRELPSCMRKFESIMFALSSLFPYNNPQPKTGNSLPGYFILFYCYKLYWAAGLASFSGKLLFHQLLN
jgi:hypothetical protein